MSSKIGKTDILPALRRSIGKLAFALHRPCPRGRQIG
jgi:hypothetical protein